MGSKICFPVEDQSVEPTQEEQSSKSREEKLKEANEKVEAEEKARQEGEPGAGSAATKEEVVEAGEPGEAAVQESTPAAPAAIHKHPQFGKMSRAKVDEMWELLRKDTPRPTDDFIRKSIKKDDFDGSGVLEKRECERLCQSFKTRAQKNGDVFDNWEQVFHFLDRNDDQILGFEDVRYTVTVMWLMTKNKMSLTKVTQAAV